MKRCDDPQWVRSMILHLDHNYAMAEFLGAPGLQETNLTGLALPGSRPWINTWPPKGRTANPNGPAQSMKIMIAISPRTPRRWRNTGLSEP
jgi:hypothetical protein